MRRTQSKKSEAAAALLLTAALLLGSLAGFAARCRRLRTDVLRLHVTANSDGAEDQTVKLLVRDAILAESETLFGAAATQREAVEQTRAALPALTALADRVLREHGFSYGAAAELTTEYFDARSYGDVTLPAGTYTALRVRLGSGAGQNWWCVMFPPLCLPAVQRSAEDKAFAVFNADGAEILRPAGGVEIRLRIVELAQKLREKLRDK